MANLHVAVLAGGSGERLWPASSVRRPKPFVPLFHGDTLLAATLARVSPLTTRERLWLVGDAAHRAQLEDHARGLMASDHIILEPVRRDTAAAVALVALRIAAEDPAALLLVTPSDHFIPDVSGFHEAIRQAVGAALEGYLTCIGLSPTGPEQQYGYIVQGPSLVAPHAYAVERFVEKPDLAEAVSLRNQGGATWNSGILICRVADLLEAFRHLAPHIVDPLAAGLRDDALDEVFASLPVISLDYAILQKWHRLAVLHGAFEWHDVGTWRELPAASSDADGNFVYGNARLVDTSHSVVYNSDAHPVVVNGMANVLVAHLPDHVTMVAPLRSDTRELLRSLRRTGGIPGPGDYGIPVHARMPTGADVQTVEKPWGREVVWARTPQYAAKVIWVRAGHCLSRQYHRHKHETHWYVSGHGRLELGTTIQAIQPGLVVAVQPGTVHRFHADTDVCFLETSTPELNDVIRLEDRYGRSQV